MITMSSKVAKNKTVVNTLVSSAAIAAAVVPFIKSVGPHTFHVNVHAKPGARQSAIVPPVNRSLECLEVRLAAPPVDGAANAELVNLLEEEITREWRNSLKTTQVIVKKSKVASNINNNNVNSNKISVSFVKGTTSRSKIVAVDFPGDAEELFAIFERIGTETIR